MRICREREPVSFFHLYCDLVAVAAPAAAAHPRMQWPPPFTSQGPLSRLTAPLYASDAFDRHLFTRPSGHSCREREREGGTYPFMNTGLGTELPARLCDLNLCSVAQRNLHYRGRKSEWYFLAAYETHLLNPVGTQTAAPVPVPNVHSHYYATQPQMTFLAEPSPVIA